MIVASESYVTRHSGSALPLSVACPCYISRSILQNPKKKLARNASSIILTIRKYTNVDMTICNSEVSNMSKAHMVVLGFLNNEPMYGYKIGQMVSEQRFSIWGGIKLPSIYKALQTLESGDYICGQQIAEGNNPPRTVFSLCPKGKEYLRKLLYKSLSGEQDSPHEFWIALSFSNRVFTKQEMLKIIDRRLSLINDIETMHKAPHCSEFIEHGAAPFGMKHLKALGTRFHRDVILTLNELRDDIVQDRLSDSFISEGGLS